MSQSWIRALFSSRQRKTVSRQFTPCLEQLVDRIAPAVTASFNPTSGLLLVRGDNVDNSITIQRNTAGLIRVNGARVSTPSGFLKLNQVQKILVKALGGNDTVLLSPAAGGITKPATLRGGVGDDTLTGGVLNDALLGEAGNDSINGGLGNDNIIPGAGADTVNLSSLTGTTVNIDLGVGGSGDASADTLIVNGTAATDVIQVGVNGAVVQITGLAAQINISQAEAANDVATINGLGSDDTLSGSAGLSALIKLTLDGGDGNDIINGGNGADTLIGGAGNDTIDGNQGNDAASLGAGDDIFVWDPGDGSDVVEGQEGSDTLRFNGSAGAEIFAGSANGARLSFTRNLGNIVMDTNDVEILALNALGGADTATINDLTGTDVSTVNIDLGVGGAGDAGADTVNVNGTAAADVIQAIANGAAVQVNGLTAQVNLVQTEVANDVLTINGLGGNDTLSGGALAALVRLTLDGGDGNDTLNGANGADTLLGGNGNDTIDGNQGNDTALMGSGNDTFVWDPGDGSDVVEGQDGVDTMLFNGAAGAEIFTASSNGGRMLFTRNVGNILMDTDDVEVLTLNALGGTDLVTINDLAATDVTNVNVNLGVAGASDGAADAVTVNGTVAVDVMSISGSAGSATITTASLIIALTINTSGGDDIVSASTLANSSVDLTLNGGAANDILVGSQGSDTINGEDGDDLMFGGLGNDTFTGGLGTDEANGGAGTDVDGGGIETFNQ